VNTCSKCGKENQDHYKFCLGCGSELVVAPAKEPAGAPLSRVPTKNSALPVDSRAKTGKHSEMMRQSSGPLKAAASVSVSPTPPAGIAKLNLGPKPAEEDTGDDGSPFPLSKTPAASDLPFNSEPPTLKDQRPQPASPPAQQSAAIAICTACGTSNPRDFVFCGNCGSRINQAVPQTLDRGAAKPAASAVRTVPLGMLYLIRPDGSEGGTHPLAEKENIIGRGLGRVFDNDSYLSPSHVRIVFEEKKALVEDLGSLNGVFVKITEPEPLGSGDIFRIGQELLRFDNILEPQPLEDGTEIVGSPNPGYWGRVSVIMGPGEDGSAFPMIGEEMALGREAGDILFSDDGYVSGTHAKISLQNGAFFLNDLGSSNGTFLRLIQPRLVPPGTFLLLGQQLFRLDF
jgi:pSer/pThr/pTyr-binding forkhead associated (FHA) protein